MKKRILTILLSFVLLSGLVSVLPASAAGAEYSIRKISTAPTIDGTVSEEEWGAPTYTVKAADVGTDDYITKVGTPPENDDFEFSVYYRWDDDNLYIAVTTKNAPAHSSTLKATATDNDISNMWQLECLQLTLDMNKEGSTNVNHAEYGIAASNDLDAMYQWAYAHKKDVDRTTQAGGVKVDYWTIAAKWNAADSGMTYELRVPWEKVDSESKADAIKIGGAIRSGLSVNFPGGPSGYCLGTSPLVNKNTFDAPLLNLVSEDSIVSTELPVKEIAVRCKFSELEVGETQPLTVTVSPSNADDKAYTLKSSDESIASIDAEGKVTALKAGEVTITATSNKYPDVTGECKLTVKAKPTPGANSSAQSVNASDSGSDNKSGGISAGLIVGIVIGVVVVAGIVVVAIVLSKKKKA